MRAYEVRYVPVLVVLSVALFFFGRTVGATMSTEPDKLSLHFTDRSLQETVELFGKALNLKIEVLNKLLKKQFSTKIDNLSPKETYKMLATRLDEHGFRLVKRSVRKVVDKAWEVDRAAFRRQMEGLAFMNHAWFRMGLEDGAHTGLKVVRMTINARYTLGMSYSEMKFVGVDALPIQTCEDLYAAWRHVKEADTFTPHLLNKEGEMVAWDFAVRDGVAFHAVISNPKRVAASPGPPHRFR